MSYILDALKKSQAEQNSDGVTLAANPASTKRSRPRGLLTLVILLVVTNISLLLWVTLQRSQSNITENRSSDSQPADITSTIQSPPSPPAAATSTLNTQTPRVQVSETPNTTPVVREAAPDRQRTRTSAVKKVQLSELPSIEQDKFNSFNYSSHIYTDDPELCAIVINGQRLSAGDRFEGMEVIAITEEGVVFGSSRLSDQGQREQLHVAISVIEQWDR